MKKRLHGHFRGLLLKRYRQKAGMSQMDLARSIGFSVGPATIMRYEMGLSVPTVDIALKLAAAVRCSLEDLVDAES